MPVYIQSAQAISPQDTFAPESKNPLGFPENGFRQSPNQDFFTCIHPDYKQYVNPTALRRMSPVIRMGLATSKVCLAEADLDNPDAILVGSGLGCVRDTAKFLNQVIANKELLLNPTAFIQSTHNTVSGQIALMLNCRAYNLTFSQNYISFETALLEAMLLLGEGEVQNILLGGLDELVDESYQLMLRSGCVNGPRGEGSNFFVISSERTKKSLARVGKLKIISQNLKTEELSVQTQTFLESCGLQVEDVDIIVSGRNGDSRYEVLYSQVEQLFNPDQVLAYKHLVGEYETASAFGIWLAANILKDNVIPDAARIKGSPNPRPIKHILLFNQNKGRDFSWILLSHPDT
jgi:3-oxoacyl-[acyl-carrier-protein] synthase II